MGLGGKKPTKIEIKDAQHIQYLFYQIDECYATSCMKNLAKFWVLGFFCETLFFAVSYFENKLSNF